MRSIVVKHGAVEVESEHISLSESNVQTSSHSQEPLYPHNDSRRIFNAIPLQKPQNDDKDNLVIIDEDTVISNSDAKPYVFPTLDEKEIEYQEKEIFKQQSSQEDISEQGFEEPLITDKPSNKSAKEFNNLYDDLVSKSISEASRILEESHAKAHAEYHQLIEGSKAEIEQAKAEGFNEGVVEGTRSQVANIKACIQQLESTVARIEGKQEEYFAACENDIKWLSLEIAQKVLNDKLTEDQMAMYPLVAAAVAKQKNASWLTVEISDDAPLLINRLKDELEKGDNGKSITINSVNAPTGTCRIQTAEGFIDASIYRQLDNLREYFMQQPQ